MPIGALELFVLALRIYTPYTLSTHTYCVIIREISSDHTVSRPFKNTCFDLLDAAVRFNGS